MPSPTQPTTAPPPSPSLLYALRNPRRRCACGLLLGLAAAGAIPGCVERTIRVTSEPPGAIVWLNNVEVGRTPLETDFTFYGEYDVRLNREGFEPIVTTRKANAPVYEWPPLDLLAAALPFTFRSSVDWHFDMAPTPESVDPKAAGEALLDRAEAARERYGAPLQPDAEIPPPEELP